MSDTSTSIRERELHDRVWDLNPLEEVQVRVTDRYTPEIESFVGVVLSVELSVMTRKNAIRIDGKTGGLPGQYDQFYIGIWYDTVDEMSESRGVDGFFYNDSGDRIRQPLGDLDGVARRQFREREDVFDRSVRTDDDLQKNTES